MNQFDLRLDLDKGTNPRQVVRIRQGDEDGTTIAAAIFDHGMAVTDAPDACHITMRLPDGSHYYRKAATWADGTATVTIDETQAASATGRTALAYFQLTYGTDLLSTGAFAVAVEPDAVGDAELPEDYDTAIQDAIDRCNAAAAAIEGALPIGTANLANGAVTADKLADAVRKGYVRSFDTVAAMQAATDLQAGMVCHTNGFHAAGDGGAACYTVSASGTANGMDVLALQGGLKATLIEDSVLVPEQYGADSTVDCGPILTRILSKGRKVVGGGSYLFETSVTIPASSDVYLKSVTYTGNDFCFIIGGHNIKLCALRFVSTTGGFVRNSATAAASRIEIMSIYCQAVGCFKIHSANNNSYSGWLIKGMRYYSYDASVPCVDIENNAGSYVNEIRFVDCALFCASNGLAISAVGNDSAIQLVLERVSLETSGGIYLKNIQFLSMSNCRGGEIFSKADWLTIENMPISTGSIQMSNCTGSFRMQNVKFVNSTTYVLLSGMKCLAPNGTPFNGGRLYAAKFLPDIETIFPVLLTEPINEMPMYDTYLVPSMFSVNTTQAVTLDFRYPNYFDRTYPVFPTVVVRQANSNITVNIWNNAGSSVHKTYVLTDVGAYKFYRYYDQAWGCYMEKVE